LIGDGSERGMLEHLARQQGVFSQVNFLGFVDRPQSMLVRADVFILPSLFEGFGLACIEAIQCRVPVIVSNSGGMPEYIEDGINGFLFDPRSLNDLIVKFNTFLALSKENILQMAMGAQAAVNGKFSPYQYVNDLEKIYGITQA